MKIVAEKRKALSYLFLMTVVCFGQIKAIEPVFKDDRTRLKADSVPIEKRDARGIYAYIAGEVKNPMTIVCENNGDAVNLEGVIAAAGGRTQNASNVQIFIIRANKLYRLFPREGNFHEIILEGGDLVFFPPKTMAGR